MAVFRVEKNKNYTTVSNYHLNDKRLTLKAKGLLTFMLSLPNDWDYSAAGLVALCKEGEGAVKSALSELKECGYLTIKKVSPTDSKSGRFEYEYNIFEQPNCGNVENSVENEELPVKQEGGFLDLEIQGVEKQGLENSWQLNTDNKETKGRRTDDEDRRFNNSGSKTINKQSGTDCRMPKNSRCECGGLIAKNIQTGIYECGNCQKKFPMSKRDEERIAMFDRMKEM